MFLNVFLFFCYVAIPPTFRSEGHFCTSVADMWKVVLTRIPPPVVD